MYQLKFTLKQHTPIIHFQHDQVGATLRATEVKPKLDRFILMKLGREADNTLTDNDAIYKKGKEVANSNGWLIDKDKGALDYKMRVEPNHKSPTEIQKGHGNSPMYFANMGNAENFKHFKYSDEDIECVISTFNLKTGSEKITLSKYIESNIYEFFFQNNFGTRQSKGYGSFEVINIINSENFTKNKQFNYKIELKNVTEWNEAMLQIAYFYKALRSGFNLINKPQYNNNPYDSSKASQQINTTSYYYLKPIIFLFAKERGYQWDKKTIKETYLNDEYAYRRPTNSEKKDRRLNLSNNDKIEELSFKKHIAKYQNSEILNISSLVGKNDCLYDFKDLLGLSSEESWRSYGKTFVKENVRNTSISASINPYSKNDPNKIERFKSPIFFKVQKEQSGYVVYIILNDVPDEYIGSKYSVSPKKERSNLVLEIPNFSIKDFFSFISDKSKLDIKTYLPQIPTNYSGYNNRDREKHNEKSKINKILETFITQIQNSTKS